MQNGLQTSKNCTCCKNTIMTLTFHFRGSLLTFWRQWKLQRWIANHKLFVFWLIHYWIGSFCQTWIFSHFLINVPIQCCSQKAIFTHIIPTSSFFIKFWDLLSFWVLITTSHSKIRKNMFLLSHDENTKCQFKRWEH